MMSDTTLKQCRACGIEKPIDQFLSVQGNRSTSKNEAQRLPEPVRSIARPTAPGIAPEAPAQSSPTYHYRGLHSSDGPVEADARRDLLAKQRENRRVRRAGLDPSPTPPLRQLIAKRSENSLRLSALSSVDSSPFRQTATGFFLCATCIIARGDEDRVRVGANTCVYCEHGVAFEGQAKYCTQCQHSRARLGFCDEEGDEFHFCNVCRLERESSHASSRATSRAVSRVASRTTSPVRRQQSSSIQASEQQEGTHIGDPAFQMGDPTFLSHPALTDSDWGLLREFHEALRNNIMEECARCRERWGHIARWLQFLRLNHPGYRGIDIDEANLSRLPADGDVRDAVLGVEGEADLPVPGLDSDADEDLDLPSGPPETVVVPDLLAGEEELEAGLSPLEKYKQRNEELGDVTYFKFLSRFNIQSANNIYELRPGTPSRVLNYFPEYKRERPEQEEDYCRVKMMLHHPFRDVEDLKLVGSVAGQPWGTFKEAYTHCQSNHHHEDDHYDVPEPPEPDAPPEDEPNAPDDEIRQAWMEMAGHLPQRDGTRVEDPNALGERDLDRGYDWDFWVARRPELSSDFWKVMKTDHPATLDGVHSSATVEGLEEKQRELYDLIVGHYERLRHGTEDPGHLQINLDGKAGTDVPRFKDALRIYGTRDKVQEYNFAKLRDLNRPVLKINALHHGPRAQYASTDDAGNLEATLHLSIGSRVMLSENVWTEHGLVNGAFGTVHEIVWQEGDGEARHRAPFALLVKFDNYTGPGFVCTENDEILVPIFMSTREFFQRNNPCLRTQFPVTLAYAITIHKAQGMTVPMAVFNITARDFTPGLTYVAISRVKTLDGVLFEEPFDFDRFRRRPSDFVRMRLADVERRRSQHYQREPSPDPAMAFDLPLRLSSPVGPSSDSEDSDWSSPS
ncbi:hypothetical protein Egran_04570 [Elaphomyces granulatus]|uniref:ATP-dependent DNA helicase PIF1 n=1 Tax=Elaphomyces granulatus TaxID=519963 RepID=A0A232LU33_9EURO|nr:hypothetical protein Egran_04570 [Elaphomyces granulatus]